MRGYGLERKVLTLRSVPQHVRQKLSVETAHVHAVRRGPQDPGHDIDGLPVIEAALLADGRQRSFSYSLNAPSPDGFQGRSRYQSSHDADQALGVHVPVLGGRLTILNVTYAARHEIFTLGAECVKPRQGVE